MRLKYHVLTFSAALFAALAAAPAFAHDVKDPVCRMIVDSDTTPYTHKVGGKTYYFCSKQCETTFAQTPDRYVKLAELLESAGARQYIAEVQTTPQRPIARQPVEMAFMIRYADTKELVRDFEVVHEKLLHLVMVTEDLAWFEHQHPRRGEDGIFRLTWTLPRAGRYHLYLDFTPSDGDNQVIRLPLTVGGSPARSLPPRSDTKRVKEVGDYRVHLQIRDEPLRMEKAAILTYTFSDRQGRPLHDMQPFIGSMGHLFAVSQDGTEVVHTHALYPTAPTGSGPSAAEGHVGIRVTPEMATKRGPAFSFKLTVPTSGLYKVWTQFMRNNRVITVPFTFQVKELWEESTVATIPAQTSGRVQQATIVIDGEYQPARVAVKAGRPVELTFLLKEEAGCGNVLQVPALGVKRTLKPGAKTVVTFTPKKAGTLRFTCGMEMYRGEIVVN